MDIETEQRFFEYLLTVCKVYGSINYKFQIIDKLPEMYTPFWFGLYLYKEEFGDIIIEDNGNGIEYVDELKSCAIEYRRSMVDYEKRIVGDGRIYLIKEYYDEDGELIKKPPELEKWYNSLVKWIKKNVPYQEIHYHYRVNNGDIVEGTRKEYFSDSLRPLIEARYNEE
jgi:hypothetical protein